MPRVLVLGDDMTGSNATGALFARLGLRTVVVSAPLAERPVVLAAGSGVDALVVNLSSRYLSPDASREAVRLALRQAGPVELTVKRVDTTLRGNLGPETDAVLGDARAGTRALVVPAFPDAGRVTLGGLHVVDGVPLAETSAARDPLTPVHSSRVATVLLAGIDRSIREVPLDVIEAGVEATAAALDKPAEHGTPAELVVCDATTNAHLTTIARAAATITARMGTHWVSVDSGPFGVRLAAALGISPGSGPTRPVFAVIGSVTELTGVQVAHLESELDARFVDVALDHLAPQWIADQAAGLFRAKHSVIGIRTRLPPHGTQVDPVAAARIPEAMAAATRIVFEQHDIGGLYATGGDIAAAVTARLAADGFEIDTDVLPLAVAGRLVGGPWHGLPFATKGGLIGGQDAAVACIDHLNFVIARDRRIARNATAERTSR